MTKDEIGAKIKQLRNQRGISQDELGKALDKSHAAISDIERGKTDLAVSDLYSIAKFFDVSVTEFLENQQTPAVTHFRDAKDITPKEKELADKVAMDFIALARKLAEEQKDK